MTAHVLCEQLCHTLQDRGMVDRKAHSPSGRRWAWSPFFLLSFQDPHSILRVILRQQLFLDSQGRTKGSVRKNYPKLEIGERDYWVLFERSAGLAPLIDFLLTGLFDNPVETEVG